MAPENSVLEKTVELSIDQPIEKTDKVKGIPRGLLYLVKKDHSFKEIKDINIEELDIKLKVYVYNDLRTAGIKNLGELVIYNIKELGYIGLRNKSLIELKKIANKYGFSFKTDQVIPRTKNLIEFKEKINKIADEYGFCFKKNKEGYELIKKES